MRAHTLTNIARTKIKRKTQTGKKGNKTLYGNNKCCLTLFLISNRNNCARFNSTVQTQWTAVHSKGRLLVVALRIRLQLLWNVVNRIKWILTRCDSFSISAVDSWLAMASSDQRGMVKLSLVLCVFAKFFYRWFRTIGSACAIVVVATIRRASAFICVDFFAFPWYFCTADKMFWISFGAMRCILWILISNNSVMNEIKATNLDGYRNTTICKIFHWRWGECLDVVSLSKSSAP